ncbi:unnamed protein product [Notodromas monacha]|uniref:Uncharacterized protein n=1 Tax=Notodromas monacha TaxID=399045 RepID=A0A7R9G8B7_9CRUS|nr:unnamed protein product [Notodromas monacha]CAG0912985.1 unnamed protein product [Notodromas monacha]
MSGSRPEAREGNVGGVAPEELSLKKEKAPVKPPQVEFQGTSKIFESGIDLPAISVLILIPGLENSVERLVGTKTGIKVSASRGFAVGPT